MESIGSLFFLKKAKYSAVNSRANATMIETMQIAFFDLNTSFSMEPLYLEKRNFGLFFLLFLRKRCRRSGSKVADKINRQNGDSALKKE